MRKIIASAILAVVAAGGSAVAGPGPNGHNNHGLCTAYFSGSETGRANKRKAPPFQALEDAAGVEEGDSPAEINRKVREWCNANAPHPGGGNPGGAGTDSTRSAKGGRR